MGIMETADFEYLLSIAETSRLSSRKKRDFIFIVLTQTDEEIAAMASEVRKDEDSFEILALNVLSSGKLIKRRLDDKQFLTYDEEIIKKAMQSAPPEEGN